MSIHRRITPGSPTAAAAYRGVMLGSVPRLGRAQSRAARCLRRALWTTALDRIPEDERRWIARIEAWRDELMSAVPQGTGKGEHGGGPGMGPFVAWMSIPPVWARLLMRIVRELAPASCLELGTGPGISAAYQGAALELSGAGSLDTFEQHRGWLNVAEQGIARLGLDSRIELRANPGSTSMDDAVSHLAPLDYVFMDADHTDEATLAHFQTILPHLSRDAVVVVDDIGWDAGMRRAWEAMSAHRRVAKSLGLRRLGILIIAGSLAGT